MCPAPATRTCTVPGASASISATSASSTTSPRGRHQQPRRPHPRQVRVHVVLVKPLEAGDHRPLLARVQPLGAQLQLLGRPARAVRLHLLARHPLARLRHRVHVPRQLRRVRPPARPRHRRIHHRQPRQPRLARARRTDPDARAHRVAHHAVARQPQRARKRQQVLGLHIQAIVQLRPRLRQPAPAHIQDVGVELLAKTLAHEPQVTAGLVIPGTMITGSRPARSPP